MNEFGQQILDFLRGDPDTYYSRKEICKKAVHKSVYEENPHWATQPLSSLLNEGHLEQNDSGHYRIKIERYESKDDPY
jgi:hypothetical protein